MPNRISTPLNSKLAEAPVPEETASRVDYDFEACPICGRKGAREWLQGRDRFHGRMEAYTLVRCPVCSLVWLSNSPEPLKMYLHYTDAYHKLISAGGENSPVRWRERKATLRQYKQSGTLLDLGCSSGAFLESLKGEPWKLYGIEMSAEGARTAEARSGAHVFAGDIPDAPFAPESFDVITCFDVLEHLYEPLRVMVKVREWLKPGGIFYVMVPNIDSAEANLFGTYWHGLELPRHLFHYSPASIRYLARSVGLEEVSLIAGRNPAVGTSLRYLWDDIFKAVGIRRTPTAYLETPSHPWRMARKLVRMTVLRLILATFPLMGGGESMGAILRKGFSRQEGEEPTGHGTLDRATKFSAFEPSH